MKVKTLDKREFDYPISEVIRYFKISIAMYICICIYIYIYIYICDQAC